ncbi:hypothetical protein [Dyadobacter sp. NIV53]|uniref:hypothetical protein n=1 Tax=Dyadobacter sp. NIV53 TaxID=2861765 RepID=UPI001C86C22A|nr:hypothetical protein [Dyadobacter sp. NIV53]
MAERKTITVDTTFGESDSWFTISIKNGLQWNLDLKVKHVSISKEASDTTYRIVLRPDFAAFEGVFFPIQIIAELNIETDEESLDLFVESGTRGSLIIKSNIGSHEYNIQRTSEEFTLAI